MPKYPKNKKGKQPLRPQRGPDGRWKSLRPEPDPPDDQRAEAHLVTTIDEDPVTAGGLVIREPSPARALLSIKQAARRVPRQGLSSSGERTAPVDQASSDPDRTRA